MKIEVSPLQLAEWLIHGIAVIIALLQVDSVNDRTRWSDTMGESHMGTNPQHSREGKAIFLIVESSDALSGPRHEAVIFPLHLSH